MGLQDRLAAAAVRPVEIPIRLLDEDLTVRQLTQADAARVAVWLQRSGGHDEFDLFVGTLRWALRDLTGKPALASYEQAEQLLNVIGEADMAALRSALEQLDVDGDDGDDGDNGEDPVEVGKGS